MLGSERDALALGRAVCFLGMETAVLGPEGGNSGFYDAETMA